MYVRKDTKIEVYSSNSEAVEGWFKGLGSGVTSEFVNHIIRSGLKRSSIKPVYKLTPAVQGQPYFTAKELAQIYGYPAPDPSVHFVVGVVSSGAGLFGTVNAEGVLTNGDVQAYWSYIGIPTNQHPRVIVKPIDGATNSPTAGGSDTMENTLDVEAIGGACPSPNLTIILYIRGSGGYYNVLNYIYNTPVVVGGITYQPNIISISSSLSELYSSEAINPTVNSLFDTITGAGISIFCSTGDFGADGKGPPGNDISFPASHPKCTAVGGTTLVCPNNIYDTSTVEIAWKDGGGGTSVIFSKPSYQSRLSGTFRSIPDICAVGDPKTGMVVLLDGDIYIIGGTSLSAPLVAAFFACINYRNYVNPLLYNAPSDCFHDITYGSIGGGIYTNPGYDRCTGRGSINGVNLLSYINGVKVTGVTLNQSTASVTVGNTLQLTANVIPANATFKKVFWSSSNVPCARVSGNGLITALFAGSATITARTDDSSYVASCALTVV
jgi:subtilase family serine protease